VRECDQFIIPDRTIDYPLHFLALADTQKNYHLAYFYLIVIIHTLFF